MTELYVITIMMIIGAVVAIEVETLISSVVALGAVGTGLTLAFLFLKAPDLAITQLVVEILSLIILLRATVGRDVPEPKLLSRRIVLCLGLLFVPLFVVFATRAMKVLPAVGAPIMKMGGYYLANGLQHTGAANIVAAIILDYRGYDTLGEATVLLTSVVAVLIVARQQGRKK